MDKHIRILICSIVTLLLAACAHPTPQLAETTEEPTKGLATETAVSTTANAVVIQPTPTVIAIATGVPTSTQGPTMTPSSVTRTPKPPTATAMPFIGSLKGQGPWLIFAENYSTLLYSVSAVDGTISQLTEDTGSAFDMSPNATGTSTPIALIDNSGILSLTIHDVATGTREVITKLLPDDEPDDDVLIRLREAITSYASYPLWSPDGTRLAFPGAMDGGSTDLYIYTPATGTIARTSSGPSDIASLSWSPDGQWVIYSAREEGSDKRAVWASRPDGSRNSLLYYRTPVEGEGGDLVIHGWVNANTPIFGFRGFHSQFENVYAGDIEGENSTLLKSTTQNTSVASDGTILFVIRNDNDPFTYDLVMQRNGQEWSVETADRQTSLSAVWHEQANLFIVGRSESSATFGVDTSGTIIDLAVPSDASNPYSITMWPAISPDGEHWAWYGSIPADGVDALAGLYVGALLAPPVEVSTLAVNWVSWSPDSQYFAAYGASSDGVNASIWIAVAPEFKLKLVMNGAGFGPAGWVMP